MNVDFFQGRDGVWWLWFVVAVVVLGSGVVGAITGIGWDDGQDPTSGCEKFVSQVAYENCMENQMQRSDVP